MDFANYNLDPGIFDEMFLPDGEPREGSRLLHDALTQLSQEEISGIQERVTHSFSTEGITSRFTATRRRRSASFPSTASLAS